ALGNTLVRALATPGHAPAHHAYVVADLRRGTGEPWLVFTGDSLLVGDVGRPDLHAGGDSDAKALAEASYGSLGRLLELPDQVLVYRVITAARFAGAACPATRSPRSVLSAASTKHFNTRTQRASRGRC